MDKISKEAEQFVESNKGKKIVFTNGCFDILHRGHVTYLNQAKAQGDLLFLGLNSDASVRKIKGEGRPINDEESRKFILENLRSVDFVEIFHDDTPLELIKQVKPSVLVKGGDWEIDQIVTITGSVCCYPHTDIITHNDMLRTVTQLHKSIGIDNKDCISFHA